MLDCIQTARAPGLTSGKIDEALADRFLDAAGRAAAVYLVCRNDDIEESVVVNVADGWRVDAFGAVPPVRQEHRPAGQ